MIPLFSTAQTEPQEPHMVDDTLITRTGFKIYEGLKLKTGTGAMPDGDFKFVRINSASFFRYSSTNGYNGLANQANSFPRGNAGLQFKVVRIDKRGSKKNGFVYYPILGNGLVRYEVDIENAIAAGEIVVPDEFKPKQASTGGTVVVKQEVSVADEIVKLKKLLDDGILTKEEFDAQKKKLLEKSN